MWFQQNMLSKHSFVYSFAFPYPSWTNSLYRYQDWNVFTFFAAFFEPNYSICKIGFKLGVDGIGHINIRKKCHAIVSIQVVCICICTFGYPYPIPFDHPWSIKNKEKGRNFVQFAVGSNEFRSSRISMSLGWSLFL